MPLDLWKRSSKIRENFVSDLQLSMIYIDYGVTIDLQKKLGLLFKKHFS